MATEKIKAVRRKRFRTELATILLSSSLFLEILSTRTGIKAEERAPKIRSWKIKSGILKLAKKISAVLSAPNLLAIMISRISPRKLLIR